MLIPASNTNSNYNSDAKKDVLLQTGRAYVYNISEERCSSFVRILFDGGSQRSYVTDNLVKRLKLPVIRKERLTISTFGSAECSAKDIDVVQLKVKSTLSFQNFVYVEALVIPIICTPIPNQRPKTVKSQYKHLENLFLSDYTDCDKMEIDVLIGADFCYSFLSGRCIKGPEPESPIALESCIGWVLTGPCKTNQDSFHTPNLLVSTHTLLSSSEIRMEDTLQKFWEIESAGVANEKGIFEKFVDDVEFDNERYIVKLPFKSCHEFLPDNYRLSLNRLMSLRRRLDKNPKLLETYHSIFKDYEKNNIIEKVPISDTGTSGNVHYSPHRAVLRDAKETSKVRPVFDCSAKFGGPSLNDCLYTGPNLLCTIFDIMLRFRTNNIAIISDIKQAFLNVGVHPDHVDYLRFLWFDLDDGDDVIMYRFRRVLFGSTSSPFLLQGTIHHHCDKMVKNGLVSADFVEDFKENLYIDDCTNGRSNIDEGFQFYKDAKQLMATAGFVLTKWVSNSPELQKKIEQCECPDQTISNVGSQIEDDSSFSNFQLGAKSDDETIKSVLGITWDISSDQFLFDFSVIVQMGEQIRLTKRNLLKVTSSIYDPTGVVSPITIQAKVIFQLLCKEKIDWDSEIPQPIIKVWKEFIMFLKSLEIIRIHEFIDCIEGGRVWSGFLTPSGGTSHTL